MRAKILLGFIFIAVASLLPVVGCTSLSTYNTLGGTNTNPTPEYSTPLGLLTKGGLFVHNNDVPGAISSGQPVSATLSGNACQYSILALVSFGDSSLEAAKTSAKIERIAYTEYNQFSILGIVFHRFCTSVYGESATNAAVPAKGVK
ncbi:adhesin Lsa14 [Leptospira idonii]|nr:TRL domain-containing protein [Leptospira idonii]